MSGEYHFEFKPQKKETWRNARGIEVNFTLNADGKTKRYTGLLSLQKEMGGLL